MTDATTDRPGTALVVGAGSGIGRAVAELFASRGIRTVAADLDPGGVKELAAEHENIVALGDAGWDATDPDACDRLLDEAVAALGTVDRVVSTVGWTAITPLPRRDARLLAPHHRRQPDVRDLPVGRRQAGS